MRRAFPAVIITAVGLGALASFQSTPGLGGEVGRRRPSLARRLAPPRRTAPEPTTRTPATKHRRLRRTVVPDANGRNRHTDHGRRRPAPLTGDPFDNRYGTVQVQVTLQGNTITDVALLQMPDSHQRSVEISQQAEPLLLQEALQAQSAQIDIVSGATYTSQSYAQSLQSALDKSGA